MKSKILRGLSVIAVIANVVAVVKSLVWLEQLSQISFLVILFALFFKRIPTPKMNFTGFFLAATAANLTSLLGETWFFTEITMGFWLGSFIFLIMEASRFTKYNRRNRYLHLYFFGVVAIYTYLFSLHFLEIEENLSNDFLYSMYLIYYFNLLVLGIAALVYYLNSFSRKAVFFSCLALAFILSDVLRDMSIFYFRDLSVEVVGSLIKLAGLGLTFLFFVTEERKLRLLNLI